MNKTVYFFASTFIFMFVGPVVGAADVPDMTMCTSIVIRTSEGWWLKIDDDGSGSYGFGVLLDKIEVSANSFDFNHLYRQTRQMIVVNSKDAEAPYVTVAYYAPGSSSAREWRLSQRQPWLTKLFTVARSNGLPPSNEIEERWHRNIDSLWQKNNPLLAPNQPDAGKVK